MGFGGRLAGANPRFLLLYKGCSAEAIALITRGAEPLIGIVGACAAGLFAYLMGAALLLPHAIGAKAVVIAMLACSLYFQMTGTAVLLYSFTLAFLFAIIAVPFDGLIMRWNRPGSDATDATMFFTAAAIVCLILQPVSGSIASALDYTSRFAISSAVMAVCAIAVHLLLKRQGILVEKAAGDHDSNRSEIAG